jgi:hypothetical protein
MNHDEDKSLAANEIDMTALLLADKGCTMQRLRISPFQVAILRRIWEGEQELGGCAPASPDSKDILYGRSGGFSTAERVTLHRSIRRLVANGMIEVPEGSYYGWFRLTEKGWVWLEAHERTKGLEHGADGPVEH